MEESEPLTILGLHVEHVRAIRVISMYPPATGVVKICGRNASGKSSLLDAVQFALSGRACQPEHPIHKGERSAIVVADLGGKFRVKRTWTPKDTYLTVDRQEEKGLIPIARPSEFLETICGSGIGFDPLEFSRKKPAEQVQMILGTLQLPKNPQDLDAQRKVLYDERTKVNGQARDAEALLRATAPAPEGTPDEPTTLSELLAEFSRRQAVISSNASQRHKSENTLLGIAAGKSGRAMESQEAQARVDRLRKQLTDAESELSGLQAAIIDMDTEDDMQAARIQEDLSALVDPNLAEVQQQITQVEDTNRLIRQKQERQESERVLRCLQATADGLTEKIAAIDQEKSEILTQAKFPYPDLSIQESNGSYSVTYRGIPLTDCSSSEKLRISMALARSLNPTVRVLLVREGSLLDEEARATMEKWAQENRVQIWLELSTADRESGGFILEEGELVQQP